MNIKYKKTGKVHTGKGLSFRFLTKCGLDTFGELTTEPLTCKTCIKLEAKK